MEEDDVPWLGRKRYSRQLSLRNAIVVLVRLVVGSQVSLQRVMEAVSVAIPPAMAAWQNSLHNK